jgi:hypothetical protein
MIKFSSLPIPIFLGARFGNIMGEHYLEKALHKIWPKFDQLSDLRKNLILRGVGGTAISAPMYMGGNALWNKMFPPKPSTTDKNVVRQALGDILNEGTSSAQLLD